MEQRFSNSNIALSMRAFEESSELLLEKDVIPSVQRGFHALYPDRGIGRVGLRSVGRDRIRSGDSR